MKLTDDEILNREFDFSKAIKNPYAKTLKRQITINVNAESIDYFKRMARDTGIPYQTLINLYLSDCVRHRRQIDLSWTQGDADDSPRPQP